MPLIRNKLYGGIALFLWCLLPLPIWLLQMGFAGQFIVPDLGLDMDGGVEMQVAFCIAFYGLPILTALLAFSPNRQKPFAKSKKVSRAQD